MGEADRLEWRRDADTSTLIRVLRALGVGTFLAMITGVVFSRLFELTGQIGGQQVVIAALGGIVVTIVALGVAAATGTDLDRVFATLPGETPSPESQRRILDAALGAVGMGAIIGVLLAVGRYASAIDLYGLGAGPFTLLAAFSLPLALLSLLCSSFLHSVGALDSDERVLYLYEPETVVDLDVIENASVRQVGGVAIVSLTYGQPDGQYVRGPRRLTVPPTIAAELERLVGRSRA
jgi:hypothetical protein